MKLKTLELVGFKSFAKKSKLDFTVPVTGVVGPNGSGKSNVVEAFRFVLGEQSMKSLRGKSGKDLIFKGSKDLAKLSRASVEITFDNKDKVFKLSDRSEPINLDYDEISLKREVYADGTNNYFINNTSVRLKDIVELLASVNIGASGHHIISQGQADRILSASSKDRRIMIEDALGLKVYQYKLKDAGKKLEKTDANMKEISLLRRELAPHIKYLKKQVEKIEKGEELRKELSNLYVTYFQEENLHLQEENILLKEKSEDNERQLKEAEVRIKAMTPAQDNEHERASSENIFNLQKEIANFDRMKDELSRKLGRIEGMIEFQNRDKGINSESISIKSEDAEKFINETQDLVEKMIASSDMSFVSENLKNIKKIIEDFGARFLKKKTDKNENVTFKDLEETRRDVSFQLEEIEKNKEKIVKEISDLQKDIENSRVQTLKDQEERFSLETMRNRLSSEGEILKARRDTYLIRKRNFEEETKEAVALVGSQILGYMNEERTQNMLQIDDLKKQIERIKIRLEDIGVGSGAEVMKEYQEITDRDTFLEKELADLEKSIENLNTLILDLKQTLENEFKRGLEDINKRFEEFFRLMFNGGSAYLSTVVQASRKNRATDEDENEEDILLSDNEKELDQGIEINVTLPQKKVKDLHMLSGGERSLTSIALVFAVTQVNPPPFLVLDETDAALDEANSKRYSDMIEMLSKYSQLITVTHNRETMSRADVIYGVTIGSDGGSKLLSIRFDEAENYAK
ncbi:MAG: AAA family ATPase [Bacteroidetes bacterium]|nr:AAA family ATPase [Bacteroidota bacterium]